jgi:hypothetical protein
MGRWAWMGMVGVCALLTGCRERESHEQAVPVSARAPAPARPVMGTSQEQPSAAPTADMVAPQPMAQAPAAAPARAGPSPRASTPRSNAVAQPTPAAPRPGTTVTESSATQNAPGSRVMIGLEAVQASDDEAWYEGAAKAAQAARQNNSVPLNRVVIASGSVDGRVTHVDPGTVHVRDSEGNVYQLRIDKQSRGLREGQSVPLRQLQEGTPVRASFDLVGGSSFARDIEVRR